MDCLSKLLQDRLHLFTQLDAQQLYQEVPIAKRTSMNSFIQLQDCKKELLNLSERQYWIRLVHNLCHYSAAKTILMLKKYVK